MKKEYLTTNELCSIYKVSRQAVERWRKNGLPYIVLGPKSIRYEQHELENYFRNRGSERAKS